MIATRNRPRHAPATISKSIATQLSMDLHTLPFEFDLGVCVPEADLWLDPHTRRPVAFVSHGHSDHCMAHGHVFVTPPTASFYRTRTKRLGVTKLDFHVPLTRGDSTIELFPAGHMLGAAQVLLTGPDGRRLVYTGDFKLRAGPCTPPAEIIPADVLVMECTFGHAQYRFPPLDQVTAHLARFVERCLADGVVPVVCGYAMGKGQEAIALLAKMGHRPLVHQSVADVAAEYERHGVDLGGYDVLGSEPATGRVVVCPPHLKASVVAGLGRCRTAMLTGWAMDARMRYRYGTDEMIPLSDHADFGELLEYIEGASPRVVYTVHGDGAFAAHLRRQGMEAYHLGD